MTIQISATSTDCPPVTVPGGLSPGWSTTAVAPMAIPIDPSARNTEPTPTRPGTGARRGLGGGA